MKRLFLILLLSLSAISFLPNHLFAQDVSVELQDGSVLKGKLISKSPDSLTIRTVLGEQTISTKQISQRSQAELKLPSPDDPAYLKQRIAELERRVEALQSENQELRRQVVSTPKASSTTPAPSAPQVSGSQTPAPAQQQQTGYWLTTSSGVRHNSKCRYYMTTKGRPCGPTEGRACKICGG